MIKKPSKHWYNENTIQFIIVPAVARFHAMQKPAAKEDRLSDDALMDTVQRRTFNYFWEGAEPNSGLARERIHMDGVYPENDQNVITSGGSGFGIMAILAGIDRGYVTRQEGLERMRKSSPSSKPLTVSTVPTHTGGMAIRQGETLRAERQWRRPGRNSLHHAGAALRPPVLHRRFARRASPRRPHRQAVARSGLELLPPKSARTCSIGTGVRNTVGK